MLATSVGICLACALTSIKNLPEGTELTKQWHTLLPLTEEESLSLLLFSKTF